MITGCLFSIGHCLLKQGLSPLQLLSMLLKAARLASGQIQPVSSVTPECLRKLGSESNHDGIQLSTPFAGDQHPTLRSPIPWLQFVFPLSHLFRGHEFGFIAILPLLLWHRR